jgi:subtilisin family serine protease
MKWIERTVTLLVALTSSMAYAASYRHDQFIVKAQSLKSIKSLKANGVKLIDSINPELGLYLVEVMPSLHNKLEHDFQMMQEMGEIEYWQRDHILSRRTLNDALFANQWSLNKQSNKSDIQIADAWKITTGKSDVVVAVVDGGVDVTHEDLQGNLWKNTQEIAGNGKDDDGNGYIDDIYGWNAYKDNGEISPDNHGTHVAGIIGARANNKVGVVGVNWDVKIMSVGLYAFSTAEVLKAYSYVIKQKEIYLNSQGSKGANVVATNSSFGIDRANCQNGEYPAWNDIYNQMGKVGILSATATINAAIDVDVVGDVPTGCGSDYIVAVTNTDKQNLKNKYAGWGAKSIDIGAPGTEVRSLLPGNRYGDMTGTSMATPHVAGLIGLMHAAASEQFQAQYMQDPARAALELKKILMDTSMATSDLAGKTVSGGKINAATSTYEMQRY